MTTNTEELTTTERKPFHDFVERFIGFNEWARKNKIKFLQKNNPQLLEQLIKDKQI